MLVPYIFKRIISMIPIVLGVSFLIFSMMYLIPGDPAQQMLGQSATPEAVEELREDLGLNDPFLIQYGSWLGAVMQGDLGTSVTMRVAVSDYLFPKLLNTLILTIGALVICIVFGVLIGLVAALKKYSWIDRTFMFVAQFGANTPPFWLGIVLMWIFSVQLGWLPTSGMYDLRGEQDFMNLLSHLILPALATATVSIAVIARLTRSSLIDVLNADYIKTFRANGISEKKIIFKHGFRNILSSLVNMTGMQVGYLLGGALFVEVVFNWPGIGSQLYSSITSQDIPMVQAGVLFVAVSFIFLNLVNDIVIRMLDSRAQM